MGKQINLCWYKKFLHWKFLCWNKSSIYSSVLTLVTFITFLFSSSVYSNPTPNEVLTETVNVTDGTSTPTGDFESGTSQFMSSSFVESDSGSAAGPCRPTFSLLFDWTLSPVTGAVALISGLNAYKAFDDAVLQNAVGSDDWGSIFVRVGKLVLEDVLFSWGTVAQHEFFGHGARAREFHIHVANYKILPYSGYTEFSSSGMRNYQSTSASERIALNTGGVEATYILAKQLRNRWLDNKYVDEREGHVYILNALDQTQYVLSTGSQRHRSNPPTFDNGHDIFTYIRQVNAWYGRQVITPHSLRRKILFDFLDPYLFFSAFSLGGYIANGMQGFEYPMIPIGNYHYLPGFRIALAPYGPEYQFINYIRGPEHSVQVTFRYGETGNKNSHGFTLETSRFWTLEPLILDARLDLWDQPRMFAANASLADRKFGMAFSFIGRYLITQQFSLIGQAGYKTTGYIPGEFLKRTPILRIGFTVQM